MDKYSQIKRFHNSCQIQVYLYGFMYVYPGTMEEKKHFPSTKIFVENLKKRSTPVPVPKHWPGLSYICSEYYELYLNFDET